jgi:hypothetical protein
MCAGCADDRSEACSDSNDSHRGLHCSDGDWMGVGCGGHPPDLPPNGCTGVVSCSKQCERQWSDHPRAVQHVQQSTTASATHIHSLTATHSLALPLTHCQSLTATHSHELPLTHCHSHLLTTTHSLPLTLTYRHSHAATHIQPLSHSHSHSLPLTLTHTHDASRCVAQMHL